MRLAAIGLVLSGLPAFGHDITTSDCAMTDAPCVLEFILPDFRLMQAAPVVLGQDLRLLGADAEGRVTVLDLSLSDGAETARQGFDLLLDEPQFAPGLIAPDGKTLAVYLWDRDEERGLQFLDAGGAALGLMPPDAPEGWGLEMSPAAMVSLLAGQGLMHFEGPSLSGGFYRFRVSVAVADGSFVVDETSPALSPDDTLSAYFERRLERQIDPVGYEVVSYQGELSAVTSEASDGNPSLLVVRSEGGGEVAFDQHLGKERMRYAYRSAHLSPDGTRLAAIRETDQGAAVELMVFDLASTQALFTAALPQGWEQQVVWLPGNRVTVLTTEGEGTEGVVFDLP